MRTLLITAVAAVAVAIPGASFAAGSPRWVTYPSCTASTTTLTCTGRAAAVHPKFMPNLGSASVGLFARLLYTCLEPYYETDWSGTYYNGFVLATTKYENGRPFSIHYDAPYSPPTMNAGAQCLSGLWARPDLNYYNV